MVQTIIMVLEPKNAIQNFGFSIFNIKNKYISTLAASFITSKFFEHNTEHEVSEKSRVAKMPAHAHKL